MGAMDHDALNKLIFALPQVGADLLRIVARDWVHLLDLESLERISAEHPSTSLTQRVGDLAWRVRFRAGALADGTRPWLLVPTELQSTRDANMGARQREYVERHLEAQRREGARSPEGEEPPVLPVVVYDGQWRWRRGAGPLDGLPEVAARALAPLQPAAYLLLDAGDGALEDWPAGNRVSSWVRLVRATTATEIAAAFRAGLSAFPGPDDAAFRGALRQWASALLRDRLPDGEVPPALEDEQGDVDMTSMLEANLDKWEAELIRKGVAQGMERGRSEGMERGRSEGIERGRSEERERLRRELSALRLDAETAARVSRLLDR